MTGPSGIGRRSVRRSVLIADRIADYTIKIGGVLVIAAVLGILVFLVYEVLPLFKGGAVLSRYSFQVPRTTEEIAAVAIDEYGTIVLTIAADGSLTGFHARTGTPIQVSSPDFDGNKPTALATTLDSRNLAFGFSDGTVRFAQITVESEVLPSNKCPKGLVKLDSRDSTDGRVVYSIVPGDQIRKVTANLKLGEEIQASRTHAGIAALSYRFGGSSERPTRSFVVVDGKNNATINRVVSKKNLLTGKLTKKVTSVALPALPRGASVEFALLTENGDQVYFAERNGRVYRYNTGDPDAPVLAETVQLLPEGVSLTALGFLLGEESIVVGGSDGSLNIYFRLRMKHTGTPDGYGLARVREFIPHEASVIGFAPGQRGRIFATADSSGNVRIRHGTSQTTLLRLRLAEKGGDLQGLALAPRGDGIVAIQASGKATFWDLSIPHPEASLGALFGKVWYEGYPAPSWTWQSSAATDDFEPKLSIVPLIFGTLKATLYSLLFAIPIALLAAIYTSEFVHPYVRATAKPIMEMMASLPSVILGFVAALVLAPIVESWIAAVIVAFVVFPLSLIFAAYLWQMLPPKIALRMQGTPKQILIFLVVLIACAASYGAGPQFERLFFGGDFKTWVNGDVGSAAPFLFLVLMPVVMVAVGIAASRLVGRQTSGMVHVRSTPMMALVQMIRWFGFLAVAAGISYGFALILQTMGVDARGGFVGTYVQRNTLVVGFAMGFAVIPIIYTLAEDALNSVPEHLRSASLACGATPWQTAIWVILPTALSGVFSAVMIGMGRAVGETMIVVMVAGNTPLMDLNIFNGLRALSANIAVELPEAVKDGSLYRVLFLTALVLFAMTFVINTVAEVVRLRFRKRAMQL